MPERFLASVLARGLLVAALLPVAPLHAAAPPPVSGTGGAVASADARATEAGLAMLAAGGNAVDAAVATALALAVTFPEAGNLGGGGFAVVHLGGELTTLDFREVAPAGAHRTMFLGPDGEPVPDASHVGPLAAGVPGSPAGLYELHARFGRLPWPRVVEPARRLAAEGFVVGHHLHRVLGSHRELLERFPETAAQWLPGGQPPPVGSLLVQPDLAATLADYARRGPEAITTGSVATAVEAAARRHGGVLTAADLAAYRPVWRRPVTFAAFGWHFASMDLPSSGGILLGETLLLLERLDWAAEPRFGAERAHLLTEVWRRAYADRFRLADPATTKATAADLLAPAWLDARAAGIDRQRAAASDEVAPYSPTALRASAEPADTTHLSVVDGDGNLVALTTTINSLFGCGLWVPEAGFFLNDEMDDFTTAPGRPNLFGLVQGDANAVRPGRRMLSSMTPTIAWREGAPGREALALGGRGGARITTSTAQVLLNVVVDGDDLQQALARPRLHHQWLPDALHTDADALAPETRAELARRGHAIEPGDAAAKVHAVRLAADGTVEAAVDPREPPAAAGVLRPSPR
ncbi:MAG TPA: gamma-glutamyltransferase [Thermoanaerobaculia bacterium]|nr:gamma-glutamyltransferase [Thermoanaerobaculia bacterium]